MGALLFIFSQPLAAIFSSDQGVIDLAARMLRIVAFAEPMFGVSIVLAGALRGAGDTRFNMIAMTGVGIFLFAVPCVILYKLGLPWWSLWVALDTEIILLCILFVCRYFSGKWTKMRVIEVSAVKE